MRQSIIQTFDRRSRFYALFAILVAFLAFYLNTNHLNLLYPWKLPLFSFENKIAFLPWTVFVYLSAYILVALVILLIKRRELGKTVAGMIGLMFLCGLIFFFWPTYYPRPALPENTFWLTQIVYNFLIAIDTPKNCFPSQHVAVCVFAFLAIDRQSKLLGGIFFIWTTLIIVSTLILKQHYLVDILGGIVLSAFFYWLSFRKN